MEQVKITDFLGLNNVGAPEDVSLGEFQAALNVDVTNRKKLRKRQGDLRVYDGVTHSIFSDGAQRYFREGTTLKVLNDDNSVGSTLRSDFVTDNPLSTVTVAGVTYYSDGVATGVIQNGVSRSWGMPVPPPPVLSSAAGLLPSGVYQVQLTYVRNDGQESGASPPVRFDVTNGGISIAGIQRSTDTTVEWIDVYMTAPDGDAPYLTHRLPNGVTTATYNGDESNRNRPLRTRFLSAPPPGSLLAHMYGRMFIGEGDTLWYTEKYQYELIRRSRNFLPIGGIQTMVAPVETGMWVGTEDKTFYIAGRDPKEGMTMIEKADYGVNRGAYAAIDGHLIGEEGGFQGKAWIWASKKGFCVGGNDGLFVNLTTGRYVLPDGIMGAGMVRTVNDIDQFVVSLYVSGIHINIAIPAIEASADITNTPP